MTAGSDLVVVSSTAIARVRDAAERAVVLHPRLARDDGTTRLSVEFWNGATVAGRYVDVPADFDEELTAHTERALVADIYTEQTGRVVSGTWNIELPDHTERELR
ncbi:hypothetical protein SEA_GALADRIEL_82 [Gordonia phage Galadriel]|uniref:Uncharacterized protein n=2 Tax=Vividuovirus TaxID=2560251 RepID=A0A2L0HJR0_9CAUD|nr:hypothetical protein FDJ33_gp85 [Gordonia phage Brandonk123]YP_010102910.1 hypothetical protein KNU61_gp82 [Gordonia phage Galadriel]AUX81921.1 hypothetical protein SEA_BRANDONK123_85 [Gordonia phage Brandonk123]QDH92101.1 hypothetical protein SEA_GALADRIEL_82 [Gordonia phage Galadriel]